MHLDPKDFLELAGAREKIYGFLSSLCLKVPTLDFVKKLTSEEFSSFLNYLMLKCEIIRGMRGGLERVKGFIDASRRKPREKLREELAVVYTRLFRGIKEGYSPPPPYESVYREGRVTGKSTVEVMRKYAEARAEILGLHKGKMPDSIELELGFMRFLCSKEADAWKSGNRSEVTRCLEMEKAFLKDHVLQWVPEFCREAERVCRDIGKEANFYSGVIRMVRDFTNLDHNLSSMIIDIITEK